jgi:hypothetical protein
MKRDDDWPFTRHFNPKCLHQRSQGEKAMTTFDEEMMKRALREAADDFAVSDGAVDRILDEARDSSTADDSPRLRAFIQRNGRGRTAMLAAAACVVLLGVAAPLFNAERRHQPETRFDAIPKFTVPEAPSRSVATGTGFTSTVTGQAATTGTPLSGTTVDGKALQQSNTSSLDGSLRVEEVGKIDLTVDGAHFQSTLTQLTDIATTDGGFVASTQSHIGTKATHSYSSGSIVLQVPERHFTMLVDQVRHAGDATSVVTSATDVTGQYVDLQARISALQVSRTQYLKIMSRTNSIGGILSVQNQLNSIQSQIEQRQAQLNLLNSETTYATLTVSLNAAGQVILPPAHTRTGVNKAWHDSLHGFAAGVEWLIRIAGPLLFALLLLAVLTVFGRWTWRATDRRRGGPG